MDDLAPILALLWIWPLLSCPITAQAKGYNSFFAFVVALFFGPLAMLHYAGLPDAKLQLNADRTAANTLATNEKLEQIDNSIWTVYNYWNQSR